MSSHVSFFEGDPEDNYLVGWRIHCSAKRPQRTLSEMHKNMSAGDKKDMVSEDKMDEDYPEWQKMFGYK